MITALLLSGLHVFPPEDVDRDSFVGLRDAVLSVKGFVQVAESGQGFTENIRNTFSVLQTAAGLKFLIKKSGDKKGSLCDFSAIACLIYLFCIFSPFLYLIRFSEQSFISNTVRPEIPPPRFPGIPHV
jgi:hypothetical protein